MFVALAKMRWLVKVLYPQLAPEQSLGTAYFIRFHPKTAPVQLPGETLIDPQALDVELMVAKPQKAQNLSLADPGAARVQYACCGVRSTLSHFGLVRGTVAVPRHVPVQGSQTGCCSILDYSVAIHRKQKPPDLLLSPS